MSRARTNQEAFGGYRYVVESFDREFRMRQLPPPVRVAYIGAQAGVPLPFATEAGEAIPDRCALALATWLSRYMRRRDSIHGGVGYGEPLADTVARDTLAARNRSRDEASPGLPEWDPAVLEQARRWMVRAYDLKRIDVKALNEPHSYGPSLRQLWTDARSSGVDSWEYIRNWALHRPRAFGPDGPRDPRGGLAALLGPAVDWRSTEDSAAFLGHALEWRSTEDPAFPWAAEGDGKAWQIRLNDFPDEWMYSLVVDGVDLGDFHDWPSAWTRAKAKSAPRARAPKAQKTSRQVASSVDPARLLARYQNGEHEEVWRDLESLGEDVRNARYLAPARAVARETMRRARRNIETIVGRLGDLDYRFVAAAEESERDLRMAKGFAEVVEQQAPPVDRNTRTVLNAMAALGMLHTAQARLANAPSEPHRPFVPPAESVATRLRRIERKGFVLPLSLAAWAEEVGYVNLTGAHPALCFVQGDDGFPKLFADPLTVYVAVDELAEAEEDPAKGIVCPISPDADGKAGEPECDYYSVRLPDLRADVPLKVERHHTTFVNYLRLAFRWGGFPGWERYEERPEKELAILTDGLLPP